MESKDYAAADRVLEQVFQDYPDAEYLDAMLMKWAIASYRMNDPRKTHEKCASLLMKYPESPYAGKAREMIEKLEHMMGQGK